MNVVFCMALSGKLTKKLVENLGAGRHGDGNGLYLVVVKGFKNNEGALLRTDFGSGGAGIVTINQARERALAYIRMRQVGLSVLFHQ
ncbi:hypothetical protein BC777_0582 [Yoonia maricola]|uniref:Uncharacterized protein n=1 Tax=Yoonia maricola TaxID=420999 RepID=A0A2M8WLJ7_9RHOB|nr:hypothetical protein [Yoonia maricola]PJI91746.1 hypothetical protein BC777_0582 [Yoonia maricola]